MRKLDKKLRCPKCHKVHLKLSKVVTPSSAVRCRNCGTYLGTWTELEEDFIAQGGLSGIFWMDRGEIVRLDGPDIHLLLRPFEGNQVPSGSLRGNEGTDQRRPIVR